jgi:hypothetical protein
MLAPELAGLADHWWIISGAAVALHGTTDIDPGDVDLLVSLRDAEHLASRLGIALAPGEAHQIFRSALFGRWPEPPLPVEIMAGFQVRSGGGWSEVWPSTREAVTVEGAAVFVPSREELGRMLLGFGRPKDRARSKLLSGAEGH